MISASSATEGVNDLVVLLNTDGSLPYEEAQPGDIIATFSDNVFGSWIKMTSDGEYQSDLVDFTFSEDFRRLELVIKPDARFHDGSLIDAEDIQFSILRGLYGKRASFYVGFLGCIDGVSGLMQLPVGVGVSGIQITSQSRVLFNFGRPCPEFLHTLTLPYVAPRPLAALATDLVHFKNLPIGSGPYRVIEENRITGQIQIERVASKGEGPQKLLLLSKEPSQVPDISLSRSVGSFKNKMKKISSTTPSTTLTMFSSQRNRLFASPRIRSLFYKVFDRASLLSEQNESVAYSLSLWGSIQEVSQVERLEARNELREIFSHLNEGDRHLRVALFGSIDAHKKRLIQSLKSQFGEIGLTVDFEVVAKKFLSADDGEYFAFWLASLVIDPLAAGTMLSSFRDKSAFPFHSVASDELSQLFLNWENATSSSARTSSAIALDDFVTQGGFGIPLLRGYNTIYFNPQTVGDLGKQVQILSVEFSKIRSRPCSKLSE